MAETQEPAIEGCFLRSGEMRVTPAGMPIIVYFRRFQKGILEAIYPSVFY